MKKLLVLIILLTTVSASFAQMKRDRTTAFNYWQKRQYEKAKEYIDKAVEYPEAASDAKVWYYRGGIYLDIYTSGKANEIDPQSLDKAYEAFVKSKEVDKKGNYTKDANRQISGIAGEFFNQGLEFFKVNDFKGAIPNFQKAITLNKQSNIVDTMSYYALGMSYRGEAANDPSAVQSAIESYRYIVDLGYSRQEVYSELSSLYIFDKQFDKALEIINVAKQKFPNDANVLITEANYYLQTDDFPMAIEKLEMAIQNDDSNLQLYHALGSSYDRMIDAEKHTAEENENYFNKAVKAYEKALELDSTFFDAIFNTGVLYYNKGGDIVNEANQLPINEVEKYNELIAEGNQYLEKALPYMEKCYSLQPNDPATIASLKEIYTRLGLLEKLKELNAQ